MVCEILGGKALNESQKQTWTALGNYILGCYGTYSGDGTNCFQSVIYKETDIKIAGLSRRTGRDKQEKYGMSMNYILHLQLQEDQILLSPQST